MSVVIAGHRVSLFLVVMAAGLLVATVVAAAVTGVSGWWVAIGLLAPDLLPLLAFRRPEQTGRMPRAMVPFYNATHSVIGPFVLLGIAAVLLSIVAAVVAGAWLTHIVVDRAVGYGLRSADGQNRSELVAQAAHAPAGIPQR